MSKAAHSMVVPVQVGIFIGCRYVNHLLHDCLHSISSQGPRQRELCQEVWQFC